MNDISNSVPSSAPAPSSSSESSTASTADLATLAAPDNIEAYAEQRSDDHAPDDQHDDGPSEADGTDERRQSTRADRRRRKMEALQERLQAATARKHEEAAAEQRTTPLVPPLPEGVEEADNIEEWGEQLRAAAEIQDGQAENGADNAAAQDGRPESREQFVERVVGEIQAANQAEAVRQRNEGRYLEKKRIAEATLPYYREVMAQPIHVGMQPEAAQAAWSAISESDVGPLIEYAIKLPGPEGDRTRAMLRQATTPAQAARVVGLLEGMIEAGRQGHAPTPQPQRPLPASWSKKPIAPLRGGGAAPLSLHERVGAGDRVDERWANERLREMRNRGR